MGLIAEVKSETAYLFGCDFFDDNFDPEGKEDHLDRAEALMNNYPKDVVRDCWLDYLYENCTSPSEVINFCNLFVYYGGHDVYIPEPYKLAGYLYYRVDITQYWDEASSIFESIIIPIFERQGLVDLVSDPYYRPDQDQKILDEIACWREKEGSRIE